jgi:chlorobactene glucosyltransferase
MNYRNRLNSVHGWESYLVKVTMIEYWQYNPVSVVAFLAFGLITAIGNHFFIRRLGRARLPDVFPFVSILVPARNEAVNIEACVDSLLNQDYPDFEILVLDDHSSDNTRLILDRLAGSAKKSLRVLEGASLPEGWLGKHWACYQMAQSAKGDLLLFTDADTRHQPNMLVDSVSMLLERKVDLLTAFPREEAITWGEKLTVPILSFAIFSFLPIFLAQWLKLPSLSITIGQHMLFRRSTYDAIGGHEAIKANPVDDISLGRRVIGHGFKWLLVNGTDHISCRMYTDFRGALDGFTKNLFAFFDNHIFLYLLAWTWMAFVFLVPPLVILLNLFNLPFGFFSTSLAWIAILEAILLFAIAFHHFRFPKYLIPLYPVSLAVFVFIAYRSLIFTLNGFGNWKTRKLPRPTIKW